MKRFSKDALQSLENHAWKGNVRELRNVVERVIILTEKQVIEKQDLPEPFLEQNELGFPESSVFRTLKDFREAAEKEFLLAKLQAHGWNISQTARDIDTPRSNLYKKLEQYGIKIAPGINPASASSSRTAGEDPEESGEKS